MTSLWRTCSSALLVLVALAPSSSGATLSGSVKVTAGGKTGGRDPIANAGVVVWLEAEDHKPAPAAPHAVRMVQQRKQFIPHLLAIPVGATVEFPNLDPIFHSAFSNIDGQPFDIGLYPPGTTRRVLFHRPGIVRIFCNIHQSMSAVIVVAPTPWIAVSDRKGAFSIDGIEPGRYVLHFFHERATQQTLDALTRKIDVSAGTVALPLVQVSESGYIETPHPNKYGQAYGPEPGDNAQYGNVR